MNLNALHLSVILCLGSRLSLQLPHHLWWPMIPLPLWRLMGMGILDDEEKRRQWSNPATLAIMIFSFFLRPVEENEEIGYSGFLLCLLINGHIIANSNDWSNLGIWSQIQVWISCYNDQAINANPSQKQMSIMCSVGEMNLLHIEHRITSQVSSGSQGTLLVIPEYVCYSMVVHEIRLFYSLAIPFFIKLGFE